MNICFSGTFVGYDKKHAAALAESVGMTPVKNITRDTHYLVSALLNSVKTRKAVEMGVAVITQGEFEEFVEAGEFPKVENAGSFIRRPPHVTWRTVPRHRIAIEYADANGEIKNMVGDVVSEGCAMRPSGETRYLAFIAEGEDGSKLITLRLDRILSYL